ncbi:hypothetical protein Tsubulata_012796 [Turnera subulata]|uniref:Phytocyanin domain-containing protein n=1 Tax=Turnera subulata TaxID=218843 RepID=A0A9Q0FPM3_9ROSI|nr:hypothetical protein Tsubulata_012796 [Turnera subulata]
MKTSHLLIVFAIVATILPAATMATEYIVGDDKGWNVSVDYNAWASDKVFNVGDILVFKYDPPHNVYSVDAEGFKNCTPSQKGWTSGNDIITLATPGKKWYICGFGQHCATYGQKLVITVQGGDAAPAPAPGDPNQNGASGIASSWYQIIVVAAMAVVGLLI